MSFVAPSLTTSIDTSNYRSEIDANFLAIQNALISIQNSLPSIKSGNPTLLELTSRLGRPNGIGGVESFNLLFDCDYTHLIVNNPGPDGLSWCVIDDQYHYTSVESSWALSSIATSDGTYNVVLGAKSLGAPALQLVLGVDDTDQEDSYDLELYTFTLTRSGSSYWVDNIRLKATVLPDRDAWGRLWEEDRLLSWHLKTLPSSIGFDGGVIIFPTNVEIRGAELYLGTAPSATPLAVDLVRESNLTDGNVFSSQPLWTVGSDGRFSASAQNPTVQVAAGDPLRMDFASIDTGGAAKNLSMTLRYRPIHHDVL